MDTQLPLVVNNLTKRFGSFTAVNDVTLSLKKGDIYALIGKNGAGKSTLLKVITGLLLPTSGSVGISGEDINAHPVEAKSHFGYVPDEPTAYGYLSGREFLVMTARIRGMSKNRTKERVEELVSLFPIKDSIDLPMKEYSRGTKQKVAFLAALLSEPELLLIDEPIVGLDPLSMTIFGETLKKYTKGSGAVLFATHTLPFAKEYATRVGVMNEGKIITEEQITKETNLEKFFVTD